MLRRRTNFHMATLTSTTIGQIASDDESGPILVSTTTTPGVRRYPRYLRTQTYRPRHVATITTVSMGVHEAEKSLQLISSLLENNPSLPLESASVNASVSDTDTAEESLDDDIAVGQSGLLNITANMTVTPMKVSNNQPGTSSAGTATTNTSAETNFVTAGGSSAASDYSQTSVATTMTEKSFLQQRRHTSVHGDMQAYVSSHQNVFVETQVKLLLCVTHTSRVHTDYVSDSSALWWSFQEETAAYRDGFCANYRRCRYAERRGDTHVVFVCLLTAT
jgi:hypothetical protein